VPGWDERDDVELHGSRKVRHREVTSESMLGLPLVWEHHSVGETTPASKTPLSIRSRCRPDLRELVCAGFAVPLTCHWLW